MDFDEFEDAESEQLEPGVVDNGHMAIFSNLNRCSGSALYTFGDNIVQCSLFGPNPVATSLNLLRKNYFSVFLYPLGKIKNLTKDKSLSYYEFFIKRTFTPIVYQALLPRSRTYVVLNEVEKGSSFVTTSLNSVSMALIDSGYSLNYCVGSIGIILDAQDSKLYSEQEYREKLTKSSRTHEPPCFTFETPDNTIKATFCFVAKNTNLKSVSLVAEGRFSLKDVLAAQKKSESLVVDFFDYLKSHVNNQFV